MARAGNVSLPVALAGPPLDVHRLQSLGQLRAARGIPVGELGEIGFLGRAACVEEVVGEELQDVLRGREDDRGGAGFDLLAQCAAVFDRVEGLPTPYDDDLA